MKVAFLHSDKPRERILADAVLAGARRHGHETFAERLGDESEPGAHDVIIMVGVKSGDRWKERQRAGCHMIMLDKGYSRGTPTTGNARRWEYWRVAVNAHQPTRHLLDRSYPDDRWRRLGIDLKPWRSRGQQIVIAGSSAKYHAFYGLKNPTTYNQDIVRKLRAITTRPLVYRPKPSWKEASALKKARYSVHPEKIATTLENAWALITHGSNACFEAMVLGIPSIILGDGVTKPISSLRLEDVNDPLVGADATRREICNALAYHQFTRAEFADGTAWEIIGQEMI